MVTEAAGANSEAAALVAAAVAQGRTALDEWQAKVLLAGYGVPVPEGGLARDEDEAAAIAGRFDGPVALKAIGADIAHKTEHGLVILDLLGDEAVRAAARTLLARTEGRDSALLVEKMVRGRREFMVGMKRDASYGPVVVFGIGGIFAEAHRDITLGVTPLGERDIEGMLSGIRAKALLGELIQIKPILMLCDGQAAAYEQPRTRRRSLARLAEIVESQCPKSEEARLAVLQVAAEEEAEDLAANLKSSMNLREVPIFQLPPAIVVHAGPGTMGVGFFAQ